MAELKTKATNASVSAFVDAIADEGTRRDCKALVRMMKKATKASPKMWGPSIVGFGDYHYKYDSGREADWFRAGFSPRKNALTLYFMSGSGTAAAGGPHVEARQTQDRKRLLVHQAVIGR